MVDYVKRAYAACGGRVLEADVLRPGANGDGIGMVEGGGGGEWA
jgi:hypothetical protein